MAEITNRVNMVPAIDDSLDLGKTEQRFKDVYISGHLTDGTDSVAVGDIPAMANGSLTETHIPFADANGALSENANLSWNDEDSRLNIGPSSDLSQGPQWSFWAAAENEDYTSIGVQNTSAGSGASTDLSLSADNDNPSLIGHYVNLGIFSSTYDGTSAGYVGTVSVYSGGTGYSVDDELTLISGDENAVVKVTSVGSVGEVLTVSLLLNGTGYSVQEAIPVTGGTGSACYINIDTNIDQSLFGANDAYLYNSGKNLFIGIEDYENESTTSFYSLTPATNFVPTRIAEVTSSGFKLNTLTTNGYLKTTGGDGSLTVDTTPVASESLAIAYAVAL